MVSSGTSDVTFASVHSEKTCLKKLMMMKMIIIITRKMVPVTGRVNSFLLFLEFSK